MIQASTTAVIHGVEGAAGALAGVTGGVVRGNAPGLSLTNSFYRIWRRRLNLLGAGPSQFDSNPGIRVSWRRYLKRAAGVSIEVLQFLIVNLHRVFGTGGQTEDEQRLV